MNTRVIAFLDMLGFSQLVCDRSERELLDIISSFYFHEVSNNEQKKLYEDIGIESCLSSEVTFFSDSLVVSYKKEDVGKLIMQVQNLSKELIKYGLLMRGGITSGELFHKERIIFGPAMNEAYELENRHAIYPRVILSDSACELIQQYCEQPIAIPENKKTSAVYKMNEALKPLNNISKDNDGFYYVNPFPIYLGAVEYWRSAGINSFNDLILHVKKTIERGLQDNNKMLSIYAKYHWLANKFNEEYKNNSDIDKIEI